jgi:hypothetical protein
MATRIVKLWGKAFSLDGSAVSIDVSYNNTQVFSGNVVTDSGTAVPGLDWDSMRELCSWNTDTDTIGDIPLTISVSNGSMVFVTLQMNYMGPIFNIDATDPNNVIRTLVTSTVDNFGDPNTNNLESDGKKNVTINGQAQEVNIVDEDQTGEWHWIINDGETFTCDYIVEAARIVLTDD